MKDYYRILGLERNATAEAVKAAYLRLAKKFHPDVNPDCKD
jgi:curved DNA-binding protein CbpA